MGSASESLVPRHCSLGAVQFVDRGCVDLFVDAIEGGSVSEGLVPRHSALRAGLFVDRGCFDLFPDAIQQAANASEGLVPRRFGGSGGCGPGLI